jgi:hypothetical protein
MNTKISIRKPERKTRIRWKNNIKMGKKARLEGQAGFK